MSPRFRLLFFFLFLFLTLIGCWSVFFSVCDLCVLIHHHFVLIIFFHFASSLGDGLALPLNCTTPNVWFGFVVNSLPANPFAPVVFAQISNNTPLLKSPNQLYTFDFKRIFFLFIFTISNATYLPIHSVYYTHTHTRGVNRQTPSDWTICNCLFS